MQMYRCMLTRLDVTMQLWHVMLQVAGSQNAHLHGRHLTLQLCNLRCELSQAADHLPCHLQLAAAQSDELLHITYCTTMMSCY